MDKTIKLIDTITFLSGLLIDEMARERQRSGLTDEQLLERAGLTTRANEVKILAELAKANPQKTT